MEQLVTADVHEALAGLADAGHLRLTVHRRPEVKVLAYVEAPGFGWATWRPSAGEAPAAGPTPVTVAADGRSMGNGLVRVEVDGTDGTFAIDGHRGLGRLVDGGDCGDTYNWCPPADDRLVDRPDTVSVEVVEGGPLRARLAVTATYRWPAASDLARRTGEVAHTVVTVLELRAGEAAARVEVTIDNRSRDHRVRAHFPLPRPADRSHAECAYAVVERGLVAEGGATEAPLPTYPAQRFVTAGGLTVVHDGVTEYELVDVREGQAHELAITLLRSTGMLSQGPMTTRPLPAGPLTPVEGAQLQQVVVARYAVAAGEVEPYALADDVLVPLLPDQEGGPATAGEASEGHREGTPLTVAGAEVAAVVREGTTLRLRVFNPRPEPTTVTIEGRHGWLVDLRGRPLSPFEGTFELRPWGIATLALSD